MHSTYKSHNVSCWGGGGEERPQNMEPEFLLRFLLFVLRFLAVLRAHVAFLTGRFNRLGSQGLNAMETTRGAGDVSQLHWKLSHR